MTQSNAQAAALHIATYSGWYRFAARNGSWERTHKALTFWKLTSLQVDPEDAGHVYVATEHSGLFVKPRWWRAMAAPETQCAALDDQCAACPFPARSLAGDLAGGALSRAQRQRMAGT